MKCPYNLPLETYYGQLSKMWLVENAEGKVLFFDLTEAKAKYIVTAINSHEKLTEALSKKFNEVCENILNKLYPKLKTNHEELLKAIDEIEAVSCGEKQIESDGVYDDSDGMSWIYKRIQALKVEKL